MFRRELKVPQFIQFAHKQTGIHWLKFDDSYEPKESDLENNNSNSNDSNL